MGKLSVRKQEWFFRRLPGGDVLVEKQFTYQKGGPIGRATIKHVFTADEWCDIIAAISREGESAVKYEEAKRFHGLKD